MFEWAYDGVNRAVPRNCGPECANFLSTQRILIESAIIITLFGYVLMKIYPKVNIHNKINHENCDREGKRILLVVLTLLWGMEIGFKFASRTVIYLLNPCHVTTALQIYLLAAPPSKFVTAVFRFHLNLLNGPLLAFLFPETASRRIPMEKALYWMQHGVMCIVPYYLLRLGGIYNIEPFQDCNWVICSFCINVLYHFIILQAFAIVSILFFSTYSRPTAKHWQLLLFSLVLKLVVCHVSMLTSQLEPQYLVYVQPTQVNLNHMICPAILDPFDGPWYRVIGILHQAILCPLLCKMFCHVSEYFLTKFPPTRIKEKLSDDIRSSHRIKSIEK